MTTGKDDPVELETLQFLSRRLGDFTSAWWSMVSELDPEKLPVEALESINGVGRSLTEVVEWMVAESRKRGYSGPGVPS
jgi:hypothetical protein